MRRGTSQKPGRQLRRDGPQTCPGSPSHSLRLVGSRDWTRVAGGAPPSCPCAARADTGGSEGRRAEGRPASRGRHGMGPLGLRSVSLTQTWSRRSRQPGAANGCGQTPSRRCSSRQRTRRRPYPRDRKGQSALTRQTRGGASTPCNTGHGGQCGPDSPPPTRTPHRGDRCQSPPGREARGQGTVRTVTLPAASVGVWWGTPLAPAWRPLPQQQESTSADTRDLSRIQSLVT